MFSVNIYSSKSTGYECMYHTTAVGNVFNGTLSKHATFWKKVYSKIRSAIVYDYYPVPHFVRSRHDYMVS